MEMPTKESLLELIRRSRESLNKLDESIKKVESLVYIEQEIGEDLEKFESCSGELLDKFIDSFRAAEYLCGCGSNLRIDREDEQEEPGCAKCTPESEGYCG